MTVYQALNLMLGFGSLIVAFIAVIVAILSMRNKK